MPDRVTMADIARLAGVAPSTVSRALNGSPLVSAKTRTRIQAVARAHRYRVNAAASGLRRQEAGALGLVVPLDPASGELDPFLLTMIGSVTAATNERGLDLVVTLPGPDGASVDQRSLLDAGRVDGLIVVGQAGRHERLNALAKSAEPLVVWGARLSDQAYITVGSDDRTGGQLATRHLLGLGRSRICFVGDVTQPAIRQRYAGYAHVLRSAGLPVRAARLRPDAGRHGDGVVAASDALALQVVRALAHAGHAVPDDVAVVGYGDHGLARLATPALTTITEGAAQGGARLVELLLALRDGLPVRSEFTDTRLVARDSCGAT